MIHFPGDFVRVSVDKATYPDMCDLGHFCPKNELAHTNLKNAQKAQSGSIFQVFLLWE
jgi:hypothetical protein